MARAQSLIGIPGPDGHTLTARLLKQGRGPQQMLPLLRRIWRDVFDGDTHRFTDRLLAQDWALLDPDCAGPVAGAFLVAGIGQMDWSGQPVRLRVDLHDPRAAIGREWLYLIEGLDDTVLVFEASVHGRWLLHSRHPLQAAADHLVSGPAPIVGDAATAAHLGHAWRRAVVSLDGLHTAWPAQICTGEHARGVIVARFDTDTLDEVIDVLNLFYADRLPGSALPRMRRDGQVLAVTRYAGTSHEQTHHIHADPAGRFILGPDVWPWILSGETVPGHDPTTLRGIPPILQWTSPAGFATAHPDLAAAPLPLICAALALLHPSRPAVIAPADADPGYVWLPATGYALMLAAQPDKQLTDTPTVVLPRPLGGSWTTDPPVPVVTAAQVRTGCDLIRRHHVRLDDALTEPTYPD